MKSKSTLGLLLIALGVFAFFNRSLQISEDSIMLLIISLGFFTAYFLRGGRAHKGNIGFVLPASMLLMLGLGTMASEIIGSTLRFRAVEDIIMPFSIGTGFLLVYLLHTVHYVSKSPRSNKWPLYPMGAMYFVTLLCAVDVLPVENVIPFLLIGIGLLFVLTSVKTNKSSQEQFSKNKQEVIDLRENKIQ